MTEEVKKTDSREEQARKEINPEGLPENNTAGESGKEQSKQESSISKEDFDRLQKEIEDNKSWAHRVSEENAEMKKVIQQIANMKSGKNSSEDEINEEISEMFYDEKQAKKFMKYLNTQVEKKVEQRLSNQQRQTLQQRQQTIEAENMMDEYFPEWRSRENDMATALKNMPVHEKSKYVGKGFGGYAALYKYVEKTKPNNSQSTKKESVAGISGKPSGGTGTGSGTNFTPDVLEFMKKQGIDPKKVRKNADKLKKQRGLA